MTEMMIRKATPPFQLRDGSYLQKQKPNKQQKGQILSSAQQSDRGPNFNISNYIPSSPQYSPMRPQTQQEILELETELDRAMIIYADQQQGKKKMEILQKISEEVSRQVSIKSTTQGKLVAKLLAYVLDSCKQIVPLSNKISQLEGSIYEQSQKYVQQISEKDEEIKQLVRASEEEHIGFNNGVTIYDLQDDVRNLKSDKQRLQLEVENAQTKREMLMLERRALERENEISEDLEEAVKDAMEEEFLLRQQSMTNVAIETNKDQDALNSLQQWIYDQNGPRQSQSIQTEGGVLETLEKRYKIVKEEKEVFERGFKKYKQETEQKEKEVIALRKMLAEERSVIAQKRAKQLEERCSQLVKDEEKSKLQLKKLNQDIQQLERTQREIEIQFQMDRKRREDELMKKERELKMREEMAAAQAKEFDEKWNMLQGKLKDNQFNSLKLYKQTDKPEEKKSGSSKLQQHDDDDDEYNSFDEEEVQIDENGNQQVVKRKKSQLKSHRQSKDRRTSQFVTPRKSQQRSRPPSTVKSPKSSSKSIQRDSVESKDMKSKLQKSRSNQT
ncbi:MAG: hypothetical protein EZS28_024889, partial [Streblomastix strix]